MRKSASAYRATEIREPERLAAAEAALRRVATMVASGSPPDEVFDRVATEVGVLLGVESALIDRYEPDGCCTVVACWGKLHDLLRVGSRWNLDADSASRSVYTTGRPARFDGYEHAWGAVEPQARDLGLSSSVISPILVNGRLWGAIFAATSDENPMPADAEPKIAEFTQLVATAISHLEARAEERRLTKEHAALRRVAMLVATEGSEAEVFTAIAEEIGRVLGMDEIRMLRYESDRTAVVVASWGYAEDAFPIGSRQLLESDAAASRVFGTRLPSIDEDGDANRPLAETPRPAGARSTVGAPIIVEGRLWGAVTGSSQETPLSPDAESRLGEFTELMAAAIANAEARAQLERIVQEQAALQRVATLVAEEAALTEVFAKVTAEATEVIGDVDCAVYQDVDDGTVAVLAAWGEGGLAAIRTGERFPADGTSVVARVLDEGRPCRIDDYSTSSGALAERGQAHGIRSAVGYPIVVGGRVWGVMAIARYGEEPLPQEREGWIAEFAELLATAIANTQARAKTRVLSDEQAALRRVAELVAREAAQSEVFTAIAGEIGQLLGTDEMRMLRYEGDSDAFVAGAYGPRDDVLPVGSRWPLGGENVTTRVFGTARSARIDGQRTFSGPIGDTIAAEGIHATVGTPILVRGHLWGVMVGLTFSTESLPADIEPRLSQFTELMATAIANAAARAEVEQLAEEQAALRRVATLVASGASPAEVFDAVAAEMAVPLSADGMTLCRYESGDELTVMAHRGPGARLVPPGTRIRHDGASVSATVRSTGRPARQASYADTRGHIGEVIGGLSFRSGVGAPIVVDGRLWGATIANWLGKELPPPNTEEQMAKFAELLGTAIANADSRDQLAASRARLVTEADEARRRVVRDLHDGAQQRLVQTIVTLKMAQRELEPTNEKANALIAEALAHAQQGNTELRELAHGILPAVLAQGGLRSGIRSIVSRLDLPVEVDVRNDRLPAEIEASAYFVVAEALTNVVKHSRAGRAWVTANRDDGMLRIEVRDDGVGGADSSGHGLVGLGDRVTAMGGQLVIESPESGGTLLVAKLPVSAS
jgi:GAF domain-containing protein